MCLLTCRVFVGWHSNRHVLKWIWESEARAIREFWLAHFRQFQSHLELVLVSHDIYSRGSSTQKGSPLYEMDSDPGGEIDTHPLHEKVEDALQTILTIVKEMRDFRAEQLEANGLMLSSLHAIADGVASLPKESKVGKAQSAASRCPTPQSPPSPSPKRNNALSVSSIPGHVPGPLETSEGCGSLQASQCNDNQNQDPSQDHLDDFSPVKPEPPASLPPPRPPNLYRLRSKVGQAETQNTPRSRRGSAIHHLARDSQALILATDHQASIRTASSICNILADNIGVRLWSWSTTLGFFIVILNLAELGLDVVLHATKFPQAGGQWTSVSLLLFSTVAIFLLKLMTTLVRSEHLNVAMVKLDGFLRDCGQGLDWGSCAIEQWRCFVVMWSMLIGAFVTEQTLEVYHANEVDHQWSVPMKLHITKAMISVLLLTVSSSVVMTGAYFQFNLLLGLAKTIDCWCSDISETEDFMAGIRSWNTLQALLKSVGREMTPCFLALNTLGYVGFFAALAGSCSLLLDDHLDGWTLVLSEFALLPTIYLFYLSARLFAEGALLSEKCQQVPAFVNQLPGEDDDAQRQYLVRFVADSSTGFIVKGVMLTQSAFLKQVQLLTAIFSGFSGILLRRYL